MTGQMQTARLVSDTEVTTIWRDGETWREDIYGRTRRLAPCTPADALQDLLDCKRAPQPVPALEEVEL